MACLEVATVGGMVKQYQAQIDPAKLRAYDLTLQQVNKAIQDGNQETGASVARIAEAEHMVRTTGYLTSIEDIQSHRQKWPMAQRCYETLPTSTLDHNASGISELNGEGEAKLAALSWCARKCQWSDWPVKSKLAELQAAYLDGVEDCRDLHDRSTSWLIQPLKTFGRSWLKSSSWSPWCANFVPYIRSSL